ncbi:MarR family transcriptional regulator [Nocardia sp. NBC_01388]|uniref:MarR family transcriptional regulator n=1 Tax=Nocardia sp. NBC_01388 TaxID=2903596 RepID=UPI0032463072
MSTTTTPATATTRTPSEDALWAALDAHPGSTTHELAQFSSVAKTSARKLLAAWAEDGLVTRDDTGTDSAHRWTIAATDADTEAETDSAATETVTAESAAPVDSSTEPAPATEAAAPSEADPAPAATDANPPAATATPVPAAAADTVQEAPNPGSATSPAPAAPAQAGAQPASEAASAPTEDTPAPTPGVCPTCGQKVKKSQGTQPGALRGMVEDWLREHPDQEATPGQISKEINRSSGAIVNALFALVGKGIAFETCERPHKFTLHPDQKAAQEAEQTTAPAN